MINAILEEINAEPSKTGKLAIFKREAGNDLLKRVVFLALDPFTQFYIRKIPRYQAMATLFDEPKTLDWALDQLKQLSSRAVTGNAAVEHLTHILTSLDTEDAKVIERIIRKDLRCGAAESTANKTWKGLIHEYPCMLAEPYDQKLIDNFSWPAHAELKLDGMRFNAVVTGDKVEFRSRNGKLINLLGNLEIEFRDLAKQVSTNDRVFSSEFVGTNYVFDGELLVEDGKGNYLPRTTGNGILNKAGVKNDTISPLEASRVVCVIWDVIRHDKFVSKGVWNVPRRIRIASLHSLELPRKIKVVDTELVHSLTEANVVYNRLRKNGEEGIILKDLNAPWEDKRSKKQVKFKAVEEADLEIIGWYPGEVGTKNEGKMGGLTCRTACGVGVVDVGGGYTEKQRAEITEDYARKNLFGTILTIEYNMKVRDERKQTESFFLPVFVEFRGDKTTANTYAELK